jgi:hypothetical protein
MNMSEVEMAELFLEINDNQKRVPSSLRWDLVRLVRAGDEHVVMASDLVYALATTEGSPMYQRVDLTGEQTKISLKQGSIAPEIRTIISHRRSPLRELGFDEKYEVLTRYISAIKDLDPDGWKTGETTFYSARVVRGLLRLLPELIRTLKKSPLELYPEDYYKCLKRIKLESLSPDAIRAAQGSAGIRAIYNQIRSQVLRR